MGTNVVGQSSSIQQGGWFMAARGSNAGSPANAVQAARSVNGTDSVDLAGMDFYRRALQLLRAQDPLPIPEAVGRAIQALVQQVFDEMPGSGAHRE
ncbi:MAG: hypothetical protein HQM06_04245 [Magnetococcales bacterium]|nr:hypothetical protein [Magnetococcales bacterium]